MSTGLIYIIYIVIGICLMFYWWNKDYSFEYKCAKQSGELQESMVSLLLLFCIFFWPIMLIFKLIKK